MRAAVITDIHANLPALESVLEDIERTAPDETWCLGDLVGYGAQPNECTELVRSACDLCLVGNHDLAVIGQINPATFSQAAADAVRWTQEEISDETVAYLASMKPAGERAGLGLFHASPRDPVWEYVLSTEQAAECMEDPSAHRISLIGHSHIALYFSELAEAQSRSTVRLEAHGAAAPSGTELDLTEGSWLLNPGSVGQPRDSDPRAAWLEIDTEAGTAHFHRVAYDIDRAAQAIAESLLPPHLGTRLYVGR